VVSGVALPALEFAVDGTGSLDWGCAVVDWVLGTTFWACSLQIKTCGTPRYAVPPGTDNEDDKPATPTPSKNRRHRRSAAQQLRLPLQPVPPPPEEDYYKGLDPSDEDDAWAIASMPDLIADENNEYVDEKNKYFQEQLPQAFAEQLAAIDQKLTAASSPILTVEEAAALLALSTKRLLNLISKIKGETGKLPDFVCDGAGNLSHRIDREKLVEWVRQRKPRRGRPRKGS
jgi:hypothetical protein